MKTRFTCGQVEICIESKGQKFSRTGAAVAVQGRVLRRGYTGWPTSILPMPADIQGQVETTTRGLSVTERCNRLALLVTSPLIPADRCEECSRLVGSSHWLMGRLYP